jgi:pimeloyl-ACP methyl ester carboxylesterase
MTGGTKMVEREPFTVRVGDVDLAVDRWHAEGSARGSVVLGHGSGQTRHSWAVTAARLATAGWDAYAWDMRGHGDSTWAPDGDYTLDALCGDLAALVSALDDVPSVIGASMSGITAMVARGESLVPMRSLVLVDIAPTTNEEGTRRILEFMRAAPDGFGTLEEVVDALQEYNPRRARPTGFDGLKRNLRLGDDGRWRWHWDPQYLAIANERLRFLMHDRMTDAARRVDVPTLLVRGAESDVVSEGDAQTMLDLIPDSRVVEAPAGHMVAGDDNDRFTSQVLEFLESEGRAVGDAPGRGADA